MSSDFRLLLKVGRSTAFKICCIIVSDDSQSIDSDEAKQENVSEIKNKRNKYQSNKLKCKTQLQESQFGVFFQLFYISR